MKSEKQKKKRAALKLKLNKTVHMLLKKHRQAEREKDAELMRSIDALLEKKK